MSSATVCPRKGFREAARILEYLQVILKVQIYNCPITHYTEACPPEQVGVADTRTQS
jgi:hypothetical protein